MHTYIIYIIIYIHIVYMWVTHTHIYISICVCEIYSCNVQYIVRFFPDIWRYIFQTVQPAFAFQLSRILSLGQPANSLVLAWHCRCLAKQWMPTDMLRSQKNVPAKLLSNMGMGRWEILDMPHNEHLWISLNGEIDWNKCSNFQQDMVDSQRVYPGYSPRFAWGGRPHRRVIAVRERG